MSEEKCKFYKKQFLSNSCELFKQPCYGKHCNFITAFPRLHDLEQELQAAKEENEKLIIADGILNVENQKQYEKIQNLTQQNKRLHEALKKIAMCNYSDKKETNLEWCKITAKQALGEITCD